jgi:hypothetical protein
MSNSKKSSALEFETNNLKQPKVFKDGITWPGGIPAEAGNSFTSDEAQDSLRRVSRRITPPPFSVRIERQD